MANNQPDPGPRRAPLSPPLPPQATPRPPVPADEVDVEKQPARLRRFGPVAALGGFIGSLLTIGLLAVFGVFTNAEPPPIATTTTAATVAATVTVPVPVTVETTYAATLIAEAARPSIVRVEVGNGDGVTQQANGSGSGVVFGNDGYILTNNHVVETAEFVRVVFFDGRIFLADVVGGDPLTDIAVIEVAAPDLVPIELAEIESVKVGDPAIAIGNPLGLGGSPSVTSGIVSAFNRQLRVNVSEELYGLIQTDAPITRGSSGGALLDGQGRLIGITTAIGVSDVGAEGLGFAVPVNVAVGIAEDLIADGEVQHAFLGITGEDAFELTEDDARLPTGAHIVSVETESAIANAGAQIGDTIVSLNEAPVSNMTELVAMLRTYRAGETVQVEVLRDNEIIELRVVLDRRPEDL
jgi:S1-C subfamily serine protease